jgi:acetylglutamate kinase
VKFVLKITGCALENERLAGSFVRSVSELIKEEHKVVIVHDSGGSLCRSLSSSNGNGHPVIAETEQSEKHADSFRHARLDKKITWLLGQRGVVSFGLSATDGNIVRVRRRASRNLWPQIDFEAVAPDSSWLERISAGRAVPVIANTFLGPDQSDQKLDADHLAATCAIGWNADSLIFLTRTEGVQNPDGTVLRWLENHCIGPLRTDRATSPEMLSKLLACDLALRHGVRRTRIFPFSQIESLPAFYSCRIDSGTEVIRSTTAKYNHLNQDEVPAVRAKASQSAGF